MFDGAAGGSLLTAKKKKKKKRAGLTVFIVLLCLGAAAGGLWIWKTKAGAGASDAVAYVQSVAELAGLEALGTVNRYAGVVEAKDIVAIDPETDMKVGECYVKAGDNVRVGTPLFRYDTEELTIDYEQLLIDIMGLENTIESDTAQIARIDKKLAKAKESAIYELELKKSELNLELKKSEFELAEKREKAGLTKSAIDNAEVLSPCDGRVKSVRTDGATDPYAYLGVSTDDNAYITIISGSALCVKCTVSEQTVFTIGVGTPVLIRSRVDETDVRKGVIERVDTDKPESGNNNYYYDGGAGEQASRYPFYVTPETAEGFLLGQHVYVEPAPGETGKSGIWLDESFLVEENGKFFVFAANTAGRIEKRAISVGASDAETGTVEITAGLGANDRIAFPDGTVTPGAKAEELSYAGDAGAEEIAPTEGY